MPKTKKFDISNEELATRIQKGETELIPQLWEQVERFVYLKAVDTVNALKRKSAVFDADDLTQSGYFAMLEAVKLWDSTAERSFISYFTLHLKNAFAETGGWKTSKQKREWETTIISLDAPIDEESDATLADIIPDTRNDFEALDEAIFRENFCDELYAAIDELPKDQAEIVRGIFLKGISATKLAKEKGVSRTYIHHLKRDGLRTLQAKIMLMPPASALRRYVDERTRWHYSVGIKQFTATRTSSVEKIVLERDALERAALMNVKLEDLPPALQGVVAAYRERCPDLANALIQKYYRDTNGKGERNRYSYNGN